MEMRSSWQDAARYCEFVFPHQLKSRSLWCCRAVSWFHLLSGCILIPSAGSSGWRLQRWFWNLHREGSAGTSLSPKRLRISSPESQQSQLSKSSFRNLASCYVTEQYGLFSCTIEDEETDTLLCNKTGSSFYTFSLSKSCVIKLVLHCNVLW